VQAFHARTAFCMDVYNDAVKAMRYDTPGCDAPPPKSGDAAAASTEALAAALAEDDDDY
jgi:Proteasome regulatory subunit C-terminal